MGSFNTNSHSISIQMMRKFVSGCQLESLKEANVPQDKKKLDYGTIMALYEFSNRNCITPENIEFECETPMSVCRQVALESFDLDAIFDLFNYIYKERYLVKRVCISAKMASRVRLCQLMLVADTYRGSNSPFSRVLARWVDQSDPESIFYRPATIKRIYQVQFVFLNGLSEIKKYFLGLQVLLA